MRTLKIFGATLLCCFLLSCVPMAGPPFDLYIAEEFVAGETTYEQAEAAIGSSPYDSKVMLNGNTKYQWAHGVARPYGASTAYVLELEFDKNGIFVRQIRRERL